MAVLALLLNPPDPLLGLVARVRRRLWLRAAAHRAFLGAKALTLVTALFASYHLLLAPLPADRLVRLALFLVPAGLLGCTIGTRPSRETAAWFADHWFGVDELFTSALDQLGRSEPGRGVAGAFVLREARNAARECAVKPGALPVFETRRAPLLVLLMWAGAASGLLLPGARSGSGSAPAMSRAAPRPEGLAADLPRALSAASDGISDGTRAGDGRRQNRANRLPTEDAGPGGLQMGVAGSPPATAGRGSNSLAASPAAPDLGPPAAGAAAGSGKAAGSSRSSGAENLSGPFLAMTGRFVDLPERRAASADRAERAAPGGPGVVEFGGERSRWVASAAAAPSDRAQTYLLPVLRAYAARYFELAGVPHDRR